jgi:hypothetical protein
MAVFACYNFPHMNRLSRHTLPNPYCHVFLYRYVATHGLVYELRLLDGSSTPSECFRHHRFTSVQALGACLEAAGVNARQTFVGEAIDRQPFEVAPCTPSDALALLASHGGESQASLPLLALRATPAEIDRRLDAAGFTRA